MNAFVKTRMGNFPDVNYYLAWKGFCEIGYPVIKFEEEDVDKLEIFRDTPVFGGVETCRKILKKVYNIDYIGINPYPECLYPYMRRNVRRGMWNELKEEAIEKKLFVKPVVQKQFIGDVMESILNSIKVAAVQPDCEVYVCDPVQFISEFRAYVHEGEIVGVKVYHGDWASVPLKEDVNKMVKTYNANGAPVSYGMDVGITMDADGYHTTLVEVNDGICLGNYGLDSIHYAEMIASRWLEVTSGKL